MDLLSVPEPAGEDADPSWSYRRTEGFNSWNTGYYFNFVVRVVRFCCCAVLVVVMSVFLLLCCLVLLLCICVVLLLCFVVLFLLCCLVFVVACLLLFFKDVYRNQSRGGRNICLAPRSS